MNKKHDTGTLYPNIESYQKDENDIKKQINQCVQEQYNQLERINLSDFQEDTIVWRSEMEEILKRHEHKEIEMKINTLESYKEEQQWEHGKLVSSTKVSSQQKDESLILPLQEKEEDLKNQLQQKVESSGMPFQDKEPSSDSPLQVNEETKQLLQKKEESPKMLIQEKVESQLTPFQVKEESPEMQVQVKDESPKAPIQPKVSKKSSICTIF